MRYKILNKILNESYGDFQDLTLTIICLAGSITWLCLRYLFTSEKIDFTIEE